MAEQFPQVIHTYQNWALDSTRWQHYRPRSDDIVITTSYKSGTTWTQEIVRQLIFLGQDTPQRDSVDVGELCPWLDSRWDPIDVVIGKLEAQQHRRFIKSHLALDGLLFFPQVKYIVVGRDARDVAMSLWNHYSGYTDAAITMKSKTPGRVGEPLPPPPQDIHAFWRAWFTRGWFAWESEGYPYWGNLHYVQTWWAFRHLPNILFVHYNDLKDDLAGEIQRIAGFLRIPLPTEALPTILAAVSLDAMRDSAERLNPGLKAELKDGAKTFFFKGANGRWKGLLSAEELHLYDKAAVKVLTPDCRAWLEQGRVADSKVVENSARQASPTNIYDRDSTRTPVT